jgi:hypothetical protein
VSDTVGTRATGQPLEERVEAQALSVDLREAVMARLSGGESRRWTVLELVERFKSLGACASRAIVTAALAELGLELKLSSSRAVAPARSYQSVVVFQSPSHRMYPPQDFRRQGTRLRWTKTRGRQKKRADFVEFGKTGLPDLIVVILADNRPVVARVQKLQISKEEEPDRRSEVSVALRHLKSPQLAWEPRV